MKLPGKGGTTDVPKLARGHGQTDRERGHTRPAWGMGHSCAKINGEDDAISVGDWSWAFLQAVGYDPDGPPKFVSYRPYRGATLRIFRPPAWHVTGTYGLV